MENPNRESNNLAHVSKLAELGNDLVLGPSVRIHAFASVGADGSHVSIGEGSVVSSYSLIEGNVKVGARCLIDAYCRVCTGASIGDDTQILYGAAVFESATIGRKCIIGGNVADRTIIEDYVTYFGEIAHDYRIPGDANAWDNGAPRPSPVVRMRSVVGQNALLIGGIEIGPNAYVAAGEVVRCNVPPGMIFIRGMIRSLKDFRGLIQTRTDQ